jgi:putative pyrroloquinoline-quinone binding quinoprotein
VTALVGGCILAPFLLIGGLAAFAWLRDDGSEDPASPRPTYRIDGELTGRTAWTVPATSEEDRYAWQTGQTLVYAEKSGAFTALSVRDGSVRWRYQAVGPICSVTRAPHNGLVGVSYQRAQRGNRPVDCSGLLLLDLATGKPRWDVERRNRVGTHLTFAAGRLVVTDYGVTGYDLATHRPVWSRHFEASDNCQVMSVAAAQRYLAAAVFCGDVRWLQAWTLDAATGAVKTRAPLEPKPAKPAMSITTVLSADPVVIAHSPIDLTTMRSVDVVSTLSDDYRRVQSSVRMPPRVVMDTDTVHPAVTVVGQRMLVPTADGRLSLVDLYSGQPVWVRVDLAPSGAGDPAEVVVAKADQTTAYGLATDITGSVAVFRADLRTGDVTLLGPASVPGLVRDAPRLFWTGSRMYGVNGGDTGTAVFALE